MPSRFNHLLSPYFEIATKLSQVGVWEYNLTTNKVLWDDIMFDIYGVSPDEFNQSYEDWKRLLHKDDISSIEKHLDECINEQKDFNAQFRIIRPDNELRHIRSRAKFKEFEDGTLKMIGISQDITRDVHHEQELIRSEQRNKIFVSQSPTAIAMFDTEMRYIAASQQWYKDYNIEGQQIIGKSHYEVFPEIGDDWRKIHQECLAGAININNDAPFERADGSTYWIRWDVRPWYKNDNEIGGIIMLTENITERKEAVEKLRISEERFRGAFESAAIGISIVDLDGRWIEVNNRMTEIVGYTIEELKKMTFQDITHPEDLTKDLDMLNELIEKKRISYQLEKRYYHKNGNIIWVVLGVSMVTKKNGEPLHFITQILDITDSKKAEEELLRHTKILENKNKELEQFTYIASHDLKEPLNTIHSFVDLIEMDYEKLDSKLSKYLSFIKQSINRMSNLVRLLLEYSRLSREVDFTKIDLNKVIEEVLSDLDQQIKESNARVQVNSLPEVYGSETHLRILFQNLINNGIKFRKNGVAPEIKVGVKNNKANSEFFVQDNGIGIEPKYFDKIFEIFQRLNSRDNYPGSGIGLANCKKIVDQHGGNIYVKSTPGKGTTFYFTLE